MSQLQRGIAAGEIEPACTEAAPHHVRCASYRLTAAGMARATAFASSSAARRALPSGYGPADFQTAYGLTDASAHNGSGMTVAIVDAYDDDNAERDLLAYRAMYGLPACTSGNGCFKQVGLDKNGKIAPKGAPEAPDSATATGWAFETSLDLDAVSAICPNCRILLVESYDDWDASLAAAENAAASFKPIAISNSFYDYETNESPSDIASLTPAYEQHGISVVAAAGDGGYASGPAVPASFASVIAVGGTSLERDGPPGTFTQTAWGGTESGCSTYVAKPAWQSDSGCTMRTIADVAFDADPYTGAAVYSTAYGGWVIGGGTSLATPAIAAIGALAGTALDNAARIYANHVLLHDVVGGSDGSCGVAYLCTAVKGYDGPTGWGTPHGTLALH